MFRLSGTSMLLLLVVFLATASTTAGEDNLEQGMSGCACLTGSNPLTSGESIAYTEPGNGQSYTYPNTYGMNGCSAHDLTLPPHCADSNGNPLNSAEPWCSLAWCYVDRYNCDRGDLTKSFYFDESTVNGDTVQLYYSYQTCGSDDSPFANFAQSSGLSATEIARAVETYLIEEIAPLAYLTTTQMLQGELGTSSCEEGWVNNCQCDTCEVPHSAWVDIKVDFDLTGVTLKSSVTQVDGELQCFSSVVGSKFRSIVSTEYESPSRVAYMYFGRQRDGSYFGWPALDWCPTTYDPRFRPWYALAASGPKDVVLVIDKSGSMNEPAGGATRMQRAKEAAILVLDTLTEYDRVAVIFFDGRTRVVQSLTSATDETKVRLANLISTSIMAEGGTTFFDAFNAAFDQFESNDVTGCEKMILFLADGEDEEFVPSSLDSRNRDGSVRIHTYTIAPASEMDALIAKPKEVACRNGGLYYAITDASTLANTMADYYKFYAAGMSSSSVRWVTYEDVITNTELMSGCLPIFEPDVGETGKEVFGVVCMDVNVILDLPTLRAKEDYNSLLNTITEKNNECAPSSMSDTLLTAIRGEGSCPDYGSGTVALQVHRAIIFSAFVVALVWLFTF